ncbi:M28 family peptidase [Arthrobacter sp. Helios]|uniref:M28 family peptidase n=1 Tax=Arthrobacter sp. Helios TaxID=2828862 RepID=UPI00205EC69B|nr:M28 family peptidase [Arthrobacter sp. Helios]UPO77649.1 M28 family peptidase [Arthrobacter sp. Helios]
MKFSRSARGAALAATIVLTVSAGAPAAFAADVNSGAKNGQGAHQGPGQNNGKPGQGHPGNGKPDKPGKPHKPDKPGKTDSDKLRDKVTLKGLLGHLNAFQAAADANSGNRAAGTPGYEASARYVESQLRKAGYTPFRQAFTYEQFVLNGDALEQVSPNPATYTAGTDYLTMSYSGSGDVTAAVTAVDINLTGNRANSSGCEAEDFAGFTAGNIALLQRGTCAFGDKVANAAAAGAAGAIVFNQGNDVPGDDRTGLINGTLGSELSAIPAVGTTFALGETLAGTAGVTLRLAVDSAIKATETFNVIADTPKGDPTRQVVVGAHLDSVAEGAGINDNGSGSAAILETAIQLGKTGKFKLENQVRFAFWGAEEDGLVGSTHYVSQLDETGLQNTLANLNFDMVGSTNFVRFVYDGDGDAFGTAGPTGSDVIEGVFESYFASAGLASAPTEFSGRSDYQAFINNGIPAGGLFTGAEGIKTPEEAALFGGTAGTAYDPCYHSVCDNRSNISNKAMDEMSDAVAHSVLTFAQTKADLKGGAGAARTVPAQPDYLGHEALR